MNTTNALRSSVAVTIIAAVSFFAAVSSAASNETDLLDAYGPAYEQAAMFEAQASLCGMNIEASDVAFKKLMREENLPEDVAVEIVSDMASSIMDEKAATEADTARFCAAAPSMVANLQQ